MGPELIDELLNDEVDLISETEDSHEDDYLVPFGQALEVNELYSIMAKEKTKLIIIAGDVGSGKTTISTTIYQLFQKAPIANCYFAGSATLHAYEERSFYTRLVSKQKQPLTQRTPLNRKDVFLHLRLRNIKKDEINNYLFTDLSGEQFMSCIANPQKAQELFPFMCRTNFFVGVLDGEQLASGKRNMITNDIVRLIETFLYADLLNEECTLQIIFSKYDLLVQSSDCSKIISYVHKQILTHFSEKFINIDFFCVAAMPNDTQSFDVGTGLEDVLESWFQSSSIKSFQMEEDCSSCSAFDKLNYKWGQR